MYHPTPYYWTTDDGLTHVFYNNHLPPHRGFGWSSLCDVVQLPIEGQHFELNQSVTLEEITCEHCRSRLNELSIDLEDESIACVNGCLVRFERNEEDVIERARQICGDLLHDALSFELHSFSGDLTEQVEDVCSECWETYTDHQWRSRDEGAELRVEVWTDDSRAPYFATNAETIQRGNTAILRLVSKHGLKKDISQDEIESITLTSAQIINY